MKKIYIIDGNSFIYRMFFALPEFATQNGEVVNALFGMAKFFVSSLVKENPDYLVFVKDAKGENFRHKLYKDYKATRDRMPDNLRTQISLIEDMISKMKVDIIEIDGYEADDVIGTLAVKLGENKENKVFILSGDKDLYSLTTENVFIYDTMKKKVFDSIKSKEKFGVDSKKIIDYLAIVGDKADNIPGIDGFGPKKAVELINKLGTVDDIYAVVSKIESGISLEESVNLNEEDIKSISSCFKGKTFEKLISSKEDAFLSKKLATIELNVDLGNFDLENYTFKPDDLVNNDVIDFFKKYEFNSLIGDDDTLESMKTFPDLGIKVHIIDDKQKLDKLYESISKEDKIVIDTETTGLNIMTAELVGVSIYLDDNRIYYINRLHNGNNVNYIDLKQFLINIFDLDILMIGHNIKYDLEIIDLFLKKESTNSEKNSQISLGI